ncbi:MAG: hypothetical protein GY696_28385 [Gammaproteobacteria bacterium]|nr:hypothetical protein [Gammaproteobacteria bacterium]
MTKMMLPAVLAHTVCWLLILMISAIRQVMDMFRQAQPSLENRELQNMIMFLPQQFYHPKSADLIEE